MKNRDLVNDFMNGNSLNEKGSNLFIVGGNMLINYTTLIALRVPGQPIILNGDSYSRTTSVHQNQIRFSGNEYVEVTEEVIDRVMTTGNYEELSDYHIRKNNQNVG